MERPRRVWIKISFVWNSPTLAFRVISGHQRRRQLSWRQQRPHSGWNRLLAGNHLSLRRQRHRLQRACRY